MMGPCFVKVHFVRFSCSVLGSRPGSGSYDRIVEVRIGFARIFIVLCCAGVPVHGASVVLLSYRSSEDSL